jgi:D-serine deaminase-like pyridoxal phosphate-dependent protein
MHSSCTGSDVYSVADVKRLLTPALAIYADVVDQNIAAMTKLVGVDHWRPHVKTAKVSSVIRRLVDHGIVNMKCATTLELRTACEAGAKDVLVAYPVTSGAVERISEISQTFAQASVSALVENASDVDRWRGKGIGLFLDINSGMNRTGIAPERVDDIIAIARAILNTGIRFRGVHYYEGHHTDLVIEKRTADAHRGYDQLMKVLSAIEGSGIAVEELVTSGTPAFPCALTYGGFRGRHFLHRVSAGTVVYNDCTSVAQLPREYGLNPAALVISTVVSQPGARLITSDAGHKTVSADAGVPSCCVHGYSNLRPLRPSEEHLPIEVLDGAAPPKIGDRLYLVPRHVCPTVNNFDHALIISGGVVRGIERVTARGREMPLLAEAAGTH